MPVEKQDLETVAAQLGRTPRGVLGIAYRTPDGQPAVVTTAPKLDAVSYTHLTLPTICSV